MRFTTPTTYWAPVGHRGHCATWLAASLDR